MQPVHLTLRGLERRIKHHLVHDTHTFAAITTPGFEMFTSREIDQLDNATPGLIEKGIVEFCGPFSLVYHSNLFLSTANRILLRLASFTARSYPELYNKLRRLDWELFVGFAASVSFVAASRNSRLHHTDRIAETTFSAVRDSMNKLGVQVNHQKNAEIRFFVRFSNDICSVSIDTSGMLLYKRGYRSATGRAPLRETTAATLLLAASWEKYTTIVDPCCGTGSLILEALRLACNRAPGISRRFAFFTWPSFNDRQWERIISSAKSAVITSPRIKLIGRDNDESTVALLKKNCIDFNEDGKLQIERADCLSFNRNGEFGSTGLIISNLPFGKRTGPADGAISEFYRNLGRWLKKSCRGWNFGFMVADPHFERKAELTCETVLAFNNGGIPVRFVTGKL